MHRVLVAVDGLTKVQRARIEAAFEKRCAVDFAEEKQADWDAALSGYSIVFGWPDPRALFRSSFLFHQLPSSGYDAYQAASGGIARNFVVANARGVCARAVAEHCLALMFAFARRLPQHLRQQQEARWLRADSYDLIFGTTLCVVGLGSIGTTLARMGKALGMRVIAVTRTGSPETVADETFAISDLRAALTSADHVAIMLPALTGNGQLFTALEFASMKRGSYLYSLGRGSHVNRDALLEALGSGLITGAGLDVFAQEPLPADDPLWGLPNVIINPHAGGRFAGENDALISLFIRNTLQLFDGESLQNQVLGSSVSLRDE